MADDEEQRRRVEMVNDFKYRAKRAKTTKELIDGDIYCVFHFPDHRGSNENEIMRYDNTASVRVFLHQYHEENSDVFFFSTNRDDLVVDPARDPNKLKPVLGSSEPPYPINPKDKQYCTRRNNWKTTFKLELFGAVDEGGESLGDIYYRWFHIDSGNYSIRNPDPIRTENTEAVRKVLKEEKIRHPHEFFYSCDKDNLKVDISNPTLPPRMGSLFPADNQPKASTSSSHGLTGEPRISPSATVSDPLVSPPPISHSPHILGAPVPLVYLSPSLSSSGIAMPELILPPTAMTTTDVTNTSTSAHSLTSDKFSTEPPINQEEFNEIMGDLNAMQGEIGEAEQLLGTETIFAPLPVMDEPLDDDENALVDDIDEDDEHVGDIVGMDYNSPSHIPHSPDTSVAPEPSLYLGPSVSSIGTAMPELILPTTAMTTTDVTTTSTSAHSLPADKFSADLNEIITEPPVNQEGFNEIMGDLNAMPGDLHQVIALPPAHQEVDYNMIGEGEQLLGSETLFAPLPVMDEPLDDEGSALVDDIDEDDEDDEHVGDIEVIDHNSPLPIPHSPHTSGAPVPSVYLSPSILSSGTTMPELILPSTVGDIGSAIEEPEDDAEEAREQSDAVMVDTSEANVDLECDDDYSYIGHDEQKIMFHEFQEKIQKEKITNEIINGNIYIVFHFPDHQGSNEDEIVRYDNTPSVRVSIYRYQQEHPDVFFYSTDRNDLVVDPSKDPTKLKPKMGSYAPPAPTDTKSYAYIKHRSHWKTKFKRLLLEAEGKGGETLGIIYFRWFHIDSRRHSLKYPNPEQRYSTAAIRNLFEEEHVRHSHEFFYSCDPSDLDVDPNNPTRPPRLGSLYPPTHQSQADASLDHGLTGEPRTSATSRISEPLGSLPLIHRSPHALGAPVPSVYSGPSVPWDGSAMPELIAPTTPLTTAMAVTPSATSGIDDPQNDLLTRAMIEANLSVYESNAENPENQMEEDKDGSGNGAPGMATIVTAPTTAPTEENDQDIPQYLITFYPSEVGNDATLTTPFTASLPASLQYMLGSSTDPGMESVVPTTTTDGIHHYSSSLQETHTLDDEMENSSESDIESSSDGENVEIPEDLNQYNVPSGDLHNVQQHEQVEDVEMMAVLDDIIGLEEDFGVANDGVMPNENQILADLHNIAEQEGDAEMLGNALMMGMMGADYNPYDFPPDDEDKG